MNDTEKRTLRDIVKRLRGQNASDDVVDALRGPARLYLESWVIGALELLTADDRTTRDLKLAESLARVPSVSEPLTPEREALARDARIVRPGGSAPAVTHPAESVPAERALLATVRVDVIVDVAKGQTIDDAVSDMTRDLQRLADDPGIASGAWPCDWYTLAKVEDAPGGES